MELLTGGRWAASQSGRMEDVTSVDVLEGREPAAVANPAWTQAAALRGSPVASVGGPS